MVYDLRRTVAHWLEEAGIPRARRKLYMGHRSGDVTDLYERHQVETYLAVELARHGRAPAKERRDTRREPRAPISRERASISAADIIGPGFLRGWTSHPHPLP